MSALSLGRVIHAEVTFAASDKTQAYVISPAVDASKTMVLADYEVTTTGRPSNCLFNVSLNSAGDSVTVSRGGPSVTPTVAATVSLKIVEFAAGVLVTRFTGTSQNANVNFGKTVNAARSLLLMTHAADGGGTTLDNNEFHVVRRMSDTQFRVASQSNAGYTLEWEVQLVEFDSDSGVSTQWLDVASAATPVFDVPLPVPVDPTRTAIFSAALGGYLGIMDTDGVNLNVFRSGGSTGVTFFAQLVEFPDPVRVQRPRQTSINWATDPLIDISDIVDWSRTVPYSHGNNPHASHLGATSSIDNYTAAWTRTSPGPTTTTMQANRSTSGGYGYRVPIQQTVIAFDGMAEPTPPWPGSFRLGVDAMPENHWRSTMKKFGSDWGTVRTPEGRRTNQLGDNSYTIFSAWPGNVIDQRRGMLRFFGGGHANYSGNETYAADLNTMSWLRTSLPAKIRNYVTAHTSYWGPDAGANDSPPSMHTYSGNVWLPLSDAAMLPGGASFNTGGAMLDEDNNQIGPWIWDLSKMDPDKVGGATGSGVNALDQGLGMFTNLQTVGGLFDNVGGELHNSYLEATQVSTVEGGKDVIYRFANRQVHRIEIDGLYTPTDWVVERVGYDLGTTARGAVGFDLEYRIAVGVVPGVNTLTNSLFLFDLDGPTHGKTTAYKITPSDPDGVLAQTVYNSLSSFALVWDPVRGRFVGSDGKLLISLTGPGVSPNGSNESAVTSGWVLGLLSPSRDTDYPAFQDGQYASVSHGGWGKMKYWREHDAFTYTELGSDQRPYVWVYKPEDWQPLDPAEGTGDFSDSRYGTASLTVQMAVAGNDASQAHSVDGVVIGQIHGLVVSGVTHGHLAGEVSISSLAQIAPADAGHGHSADAATIAQDHDIAVTGTTHGHVADEVTVIVAGMAAPDDASHAHVAGGVGIEQVHAIAVQSSTHAHTADQMTPGTESDVTIASGTHGHQLQAVTILQLHAISIAGSVHGHFADVMVFGERSKAPAERRSSVIAEIRTSSSSLG